MARVGYSLCGSFCLCVCVLVLVGICQAHKADHDRYRYDTEPMHHRTEHSIFIELLENDELHKQQKRDVESRVASSLPISGNITERPSQIEPAKHLEVDYIGTVPKEEPIGASGYMIIIFIIAVVAGCAVWTGYAYKYPHTASGQMLIRYRPSQWRWRRGEARYTAATIHM
ncbi:hypothetical protein HUJ05_003949 [Dendroctonus ponderosae]|nr:hypothetical protein HUJ05_003949 [Dendroctonus ponderosae]